MKHEKLKKQTFVNFLWVFSGNLGKNILGILVSIILSYFILPEEFGLMAMLTVLFSVSSIFINSGFSIAIIRDTNINNYELSTIFIFNIFLGLFFAFLVYTLSPWIGSFFHHNELISISKVMALNLIFNAFSIVQAALLEKTMKFKQLTAINLLTFVSSSFVGIALAVYGLGVWSLVFSALTGGMTRTVLLWYVSEWKPLLYFKIESLKKFFGFSSYITLVSLLNTFFENFYPMVIGKLFTMSEAGIFSRAQGYNNLLTASMISMFNKVLFPSFSKIKDNKKFFERSIEKIIGILNYILFPILFILIIMIQPLVEIVFPREWWQLGDYLQLFFIASFVRPTGRMLSNIPLLYKNSKLVFYMTLFHKVLLIVSLLVTYEYGVKAMIIGYIAVAYLDLFFKFYFYGTLINYGFKRFIKSNMTTLVALFVTEVFFYIINLYWSDVDIINIVFKIGVWFICYVTVSYAIKSPYLLEIVTLLKMRKGN